MLLLRDLPAQIPGLLNALPSILRTGDLPFRARPRRRPNPRDEDFGADPDLTFAAKLAPYEFEIPTIWLVVMGRSDTRSRGDEPPATAE